MKLIDIDSLFEKYLKDFLSKNVGKFKDEELEAKVPALYEAFGIKKLDELDGKTPRDFFSDKSGEELVNLFLEYIEADVPVSDFLCDAIVDRKDTTKFLINELQLGADVEILSYIINFLNEKNNTDAFDIYVKFLSSGEIEEELKELITEILIEYPNMVSEKLLKNFNSISKADRVYFVEILSKAKRDDRILEILLKEFKQNLKNIPLYASYLTNYGDERALDTLYEVIETPTLLYVDFKELKLAIEALGGEYTKTRDFSHDRTYKKIKGEESSNTLQ